MAIEGVVIEADLGVEHDQLVLAGHDQRIDLEQAHVLLDEGLVERRQEDPRLLGRLAGQVQRLRQGQRVVRKDAGGRIDGEGDDLLRRRVRHLFDVHAALGRGDDRHAAGLAIDQHRQIELAGDVGALFDIEPAHQPALRTGLVGDQRHAEHGLGERVHLAERLGDLDAAALAAAAGVDLRLDHPDRPVELFRRLHGLIDREGRIALRDGNAEGLQDGLGLVLVDVHGKRRPLRSSARREVAGLIGVECDRPQRRPSGFSRAIPPPPSRGAPACPSRRGGRARR